MKVPFAFVLAGKVIVPFNTHFFQDILFSYFLMHTVAASVEEKKIEIVHSMVSRGGFFDSENDQFKSIQLMFLNTLLNFRL